MPPVYRTVRIDLKLETYEMATYTVTIDWKRGEGEDFVDNRYSRAHVWHFDGNISVPASSSRSLRSTT